MGDSNAKIGSDNRGYDEIMAKQWLGELNDKGERFSDLCATRHFGCHQSCQRRPRLTTCASQGNFVALFRMHVSSVEKTWLRTIISLSLETDAEEEFDRKAQPTPTLQQCYTERHLKARRVQCHSLKQVPGPRGAA
ncbi:hypothetical protein DPMN_044680 [Dreissena polymorpha]|uniref:Uncharacterized protein n=1 Tax=Dreissena polymorpha TaxID=45954 RepID=A0A9D4HWN8_DREPO|nr:hypothetical protein DPMN_044680 [Dreissena polymorpha]